MDFKAVKQPLIFSLIYCATSMAAQAFQVPAHFSYHGFYAGLNGGDATAQSSTKTTNSFVPNSYFFQSDIAQIANAGNKTLNMSNLTGGIEGGYNYLYRHILLGAEIDFETLSASSSNTNTQIYQSAPPFTFTMYTKVSTNWLFTARPRIGYVFTNNILLYLTGGLAVTQLKTYQTFSDNYVGPPPTNAAENAGKTQNKSGWVVGGGVEYPVAEHVSIKAEYLYSQFGKVSSSGQLTLNPAYLALFVPPLNTQAPFTHTANLTDKIIRVGVNYHFG